MTFITPDPRAGLREALEAMQAVADGFQVEPDNAGRFLVVENPRFQPDNGEDPNLVVDLEAFFKLATPQGASAGAKLRPGLEKALNIVAGVKAATPDGSTRGEAVHDALDVVWHRIVLMRDLPDQPTRQGEALGSNQEANQETAGAAPVVSAEPLFENPGFDATEAAAVDAAMIASAPDRPSVVTDAMVDAFLKALRGVDGYNSTRVISRDDVPAALEAVAPDLVKHAVDDEREANARLRARVVTLEEALRPFSELYGEDDDDFADDEPVVAKFGRTSDLTLKVVDLRRARTALAATGTDGEV